MIPPATQNNVSKFISSVKTYCNMLANLSHTEQNLPKSMHSKVKIKLADINGTY